MAICRDATAREEMMVTVLVSDEERVSGMLREARFAARVCVVPSTVTVVAEAEVVENVRTAV